MEFAKRKFSDPAQYEIAPAQVDDTEQQPALVYLWHWFCDLSDWRDASFGVGALSHQEIDAWARLCRVDIGPFEVDVLRRIDREYRAWQKVMNDSGGSPTLAEQMRDIAQDQEDLVTARAAEAARRGNRNGR